MHTAAARGAQLGEELGHHDAVPLEVQRPQRPARGIEKGATVDGEGNRRPGRGETGSSGGALRRAMDSLAAVGVVVKAGAQSDVSVARVGLGLSSTRQRSTDARPVRRAGKAPPRFVRLSHGKKRVRCEAWCGAYTKAEMDRQGLG